MRRFGDFSERRSIPKIFCFSMSSIKISDFRFAEEKVKVAVVKTSAL